MIGQLLTLLRALSWDSVVSSEVFQNSAEIGM